MAKRIIPITSFIFLLIGCRAELPESEFTSLVGAAVTQDQTFQTLEDQPLKLHYEAQKPEEFVSPQLDLISYPEHGRLIDCEFDQFEMNCLYVPNKNYHGTDSFTIQSRDGDIVAKRQAVITIDIQSVNDAPVIGDDQYYTIGNDKPFQFKISNASDDETDNSKLVYKVISATKHSSNFSCDQQRCQYTPDKSYIGEDSLTYKVIDEEGLESGLGKVTFNIRLHSTVEPENKTYELNEDESLAFEYIVSQNAASINPKIKIESSPQSGKISNCSHQNLKLICTYTPQANFFGSDSMKVYIEDSGLKSKNTAQINFIVKPVADAPVAFDAIYSVKINQSLKFNAPSAVDIDSIRPNLQYLIVNTPSSGSLSNCFTGKGLRSCEYKPKDNFLGQDQFRYQVKDESGALSQIATITIEVEPESRLGEENFSQNESTGVNKFDIVWIIDNSGSMGPYQQSLADNVSSFMSAFINSSLATADFKMAVTTTDAYLESKPTFRKDSNGNIYDLDRNALNLDPDKFQADFQQAILAGVNGSGHEKVFESAKRAYELNKDWYRDDAALLYIALADEGEQSNNLSIIQWIEELENLKTSKDLFKMFPIYSKDQKSFITHNGQERMQQIQEYYNLPFYDVADPFDDILSSITANIANMLSKFELRDDVIIQEDSVKVFIDNVELAKESNGKANWVLNNNAISFSEAPAEGASIAVEYLYSQKI